MSVLEDKRSETPFAVRDNALDMRAQITELSFRRFGKKARKIPKEPRNFSEWSEGSQMQWKYNQAEKRMQQEQFDNWFIDNERTVLDEILRKIVFNIDRANMINPQFLRECDDQRSLQNEAIGLCGNLKRELGYIGMTIPANKNFLAATTDIIDKEIALLRGWRKECNKARANVLQMEIQRRATAAEKLGFIFNTEQPQTEE